MTNVFRGACLAALLTIAMPLSAHAQSAASRFMQNFNKPLPQLMLAASSPESLRIELAGYADRVQAEQPAEAADAWAYIGRSHERAGDADQAIAAYRKSLEIKSQDKNRLALIDLLLHRRGEKDVADVLELSNPMRLGHNPGVLTYEFQARHAWARFLAGQVDSAMIELEPLSRRLMKDPTWRFRIARVEIGANRERDAYEVVLPLAVASRGTDKQVKDLLKIIGDRTGVTANLNQEIGRQIMDAMREREAPLKAIDALNVGFFARDSFPVAAAIVEPAGDGPRRAAAVIVVGPGESYADWDSLTVLLRDQGFAVMLMDVRGSGASVAPTCPLPDTWVGREDQLERLVARDVRLAYDALTTQGEIEAQQYLVVANRAMASVAAQAAEADSRVGALMLVSPRPEEVVRGPLRARLQRLALPVYFQIGPEDNVIRPVIEELYQACDRGASWVSEGRMAGSGPGQFRFDAEVVKQVTRWLDSRFPPPSAPSGSRPRTRREG